MGYQIAICPDDYGNGDPSRPDSWSARWIQSLREQGHSVKIVDVFSPDIIRTLADCDALLWRFCHVPAHREVARRLLPVLEDSGIALLPDHGTAWHYDDKITQSYLFARHEIPSPQTWVFWRHEDAVDFCENAKYPLVMKLWAGAASKNVWLVRSKRDARRWIDLLFGRGIFPDDFFIGFKNIHRRIKSALTFFFSGHRPSPPVWDLHRQYALFQEFLPDNHFDTRITVIGNRAFGFRRLNRPGDFRASGSGRIQWDPAPIDPRFVRLAYRVARELQSHSCALDGMYREGKPVVGEISYTFVSWAVHSCPGHWVLDGNPEDGELIWVDGQIWPQDAILEDFMERLKSQQALPSDRAQLAAIPSGSIIRK